VITEICDAMAGWIGKIAGGAHVYPNDR
jgi:hypothetical protein